jgi:DNA invertase Pin-like site-specific DNA recombinase
MQRDAILQASRARGDLVPAWYAETCTGATTKRPELARLRADVRTGQIRKLYVWRLDRLTRSGVRDTLELIDEFKRHGCELVTIADGFDLQGPAAEIVLAVLAWAAKMEHHAISERVSTARERARVNGDPWGRPPRMSTEQLVKALKLRAQGHSLRYVAQALKVPRATVARSLSRKDPPIARSNGR